MSGSNLQVVEKSTPCPLGSHHKTYMGVNLPILGDDPHFATQFDWPKSCNHDKVIWNKACTYLSTMLSIKFAQFFSIFLALSLSAACSTEDNTIDTSKLSTKQQNLVTDLPALSDIVLDKSHHARFLRGDLGVDNNRLLKGFALSDDSVVGTSSKMDALGFTVDRFEQVHNGLSVVGGDIRIIKNPGEKIVALSGTSISLDGLTEDINFPLEYATDLAVDDTHGDVHVVESDLVYIAPSSGESLKQAWKIKLKGKNEFMPVNTEVFVDTQNGTIVDRHPHVHSAKVRETYDSSAVNIQEDLTIREVRDISTLAREEGSGPSGNIEVDGAHDSVGATYDCLKEMFDRDSYDDLGGALTSFSDLGGPEFANAFWVTEGGVMGFGTGFAVSDVGTHEVFHGVTDKSASLVYQNEPGALAEGFSDIFTATCKSRESGVTPSTWLIAPDLNSFIVSRNIGALRKMDDPTLDGISRDHYDDRFLGQDDNGGVHINSGIVNLAYVLLVQGGNHPRQMSDITVDGIGLEASAQIYYRALTTYLDSGSDFAATRAATAQAADDLFGANSKEAHSVHAAWAAVGVGDNPGPYVPLANDNSNSDDNVGNAISGEAGVANGGCNTTSGKHSLLFSLFLLMVVFGRKQTFTTRS